MTAFKVEATLKLEYGIVEVRGRRVLRRSSIRGTVGIAQQDRIAFHGGVGTNGKTKLNAFRLEHSLCSTLKQSKTHFVLVQIDLSGQHDEITL